jgi:hypothetical protein
VILADGLPDIHILKALSDEIGTTPGRVNLLCFVVIAAGMAGLEIFRGIWALAKLGAFVFLAAINRLPPRMSDPVDVTDRSYLIRFGILGGLMIACVILIEVPA